MKNKNNIISISLVVLWLVLGAVLMIRVPMEQVVDEAVRKLYLADTVLSGAFIAISLISAPLGYFMNKKSFVYISLFNLALALLSVLCFILFIITSNGAMLGYGIMLLNPFCVLFAMKGKFAILGIAALIITAFIFPIVFYLLSKIIPFGKNKVQTK